MPEELNRRESDLYERTTDLLEGARQHVARSVNTAMVHSYWLIGRDIVETEQAGASRAGYGDELLVGLASKLSERFKKGFGVRTLRRMRQFYRTYPEGSPLLAATKEKRTAVLSISDADEIRSAVLSKSTKAWTLLFSPSLSWTHYQILIRVSRAEARAFYELEAAREYWSSRELERQISSLLYERLAASRDKKKVSALSREGQEVVATEDVIKDPLVLEFLGLKEEAAWLERDLEQALIDRLGDFMLELGRGFCFVARQKRITLDGDHFYIDLVFYNRLLRSFVLIDLKLGKLTHQDLGQMQMYVNFFDRHEREEWEGPTIGIVLCSDKNDAMVKITLPKDNEHIHATRYQLYLPSEEELRIELASEREQAEHTLAPPD